MQDLSEFTSTEMHIEAIKLHVSKCLQIEGADKYSLIFQPWLDQLTSIHKLVLTSTKASEIAYKDVELYSKKLVDVITLIFNITKEHLQTESDILIFEKILTHRNLTTINQAIPEDLIAIADSLEKDLHELDEKHDLYQMASMLEKKSALVKAALDALSTARQSEREAKIGEDILKAILRIKYHCNFENAEKELGKEKAEKLFSISNEIRKNKKLPQLHPKNNFESASRYLQKGSKLA